jgi:hypothetical protein
MGKYAKISPIRLSRSITLYQDGESLFETLIEIGYISCGAWQKTGDALVGTGFSVERQESLARSANYHYDPWYYAVREIIKQPDFFSQRIFSGRVIQKPYNHCSPEKDQHEDPYCDDWYTR